MTKKPLKPTVAKSAAPESTSSTAALSREIDELRGEIAELHEGEDDKNKAIDELQDKVAAQEAEINRLRGLMAPFVRSARGEHTTTPEDWATLKDL